MKLQDILNNKPSDLTFSKPDNHGVSFYESREGNIHHYFHSDGTRIAGTTSAIGEFLPIHGLNAKFNLDTKAIIDNGTLDKAAQRGTDVHAVLENYIKAGGKDGIERHEGYQKALKALGDDKEQHIKWSNIKDFFENDLRGKKYNLLESQAELSISSKQHGYAGTIDIKAYNEHTGKYEIIDLKTGDIPKGGALQTAANSEAIKEHDNLDYHPKRNILQPGKTKGSNIFLLETGEHNGYFGTQEADFGAFKKHLDDYVGHGMKYDDVSLDTAKSAARASIAEKLDPTTEYHKRRQYVGMKDVKNPTAGEHEYINFWKERAGEMGLKMDSVSEAKSSIKGDGLLFGFTKLDSVTIEQKTALGQAMGMAKVLKKKEEYRPLSLINEEWKQIKAEGIGEALGRVSSLGGKIGEDLLSVLTKSGNVKAAAIGGAIGYTGGLAYGALHDTSDPTSTYHEDRHLLGNAMKGAIAGVAVGGSIAAGFGMRNVESGVGDMVAHVGNRARGLGGKLSSAVLGAWRATGRMR